MFLFFYAFLFRCFIFTVLGIIVIRCFNLLFFIRKRLFSGGFVLLLSAYIDFFIMIIFFIRCLDFLFHVGKSCLGICSVEGISFLCIVIREGCAVIFGDEGLFIISLFPVLRFYFKFFRIIGGSVILSES